MVNKNCYDCTREFDEEDLYEVEEGKINPVKRRICCKCQMHRKRAEKEEGNWKQYHKGVTFV